MHSSKSICKAGCQIPQIAPGFDTTNFRPPEICDRTVFYPCHIPKFRPRDRGSEIWGSKSQGSSAEPWGFKATHFSTFGPSRIVMGLIWPDPPAARQRSSLTRPSSAYENEIWDLTRVNTNPMVRAFFPKFQHFSPWFEGTLEICGVEPWGYLGDLTASLRCVQTIERR